MPSTNVSSDGKGTPHLLLGLFALAFISCAAGVAGYFLYREWFPQDGQTFMILYPSAFACAAFAAAFVWLNVGDGLLNRVMRSTVLALISVSLVFAGGIGTLWVSAIIQTSNCPPNANECI